MKTQNTAWGQSQVKAGTGSKRREKCLGLDIGTWGAVPATISTLCHQEAYRLIKETVCVHLKY